MKPNRKQLHFSLLENGDVDITRDLTGATNVVKTTGKNLLQEQKHLQEL